MKRLSIFLISLLILAVHFSGGSAGCGGGGVSTSNVGDSDSNGSDEDSGNGSTVTTNFISTFSIFDISDDDRLIELSNGDAWEVDSFDSFQVFFWFEFHDVVVCDGEMVNIDRDEKVSVTLVAGTGSSRCSSEEKYFIADIDDQIITLDNGSSWSARFSTDITLWLTLDDVVITSSQMINIDRGEAADVTSL